ncbi:hypothetical protein FSOLCH5_011295 [Fusarium solani]
MALERLHARARGCVPDLNRPVARARRETLAIRREHHRDHQIAMALKRLHARARGCVPDLDRPVV